MAGRSFACRSIFRRQNTRCVNVDSPPIYCVPYLRDTMPVHSRPCTQSLKPPAEFNNHPSSLLQASFSCFHSSTMLRIMITKNQSELVGESLSTSSVSITIIHRPSALILFGWNPGYRHPPEHQCHTRWDEEPWRQGQHL